MGEGRGGWRGGCEAGGGLNPLLGLFGPARDPRSASHRPNMLEWCKMSPYHWGEFQFHAFHVAPSMGPIVLVINLQGWQNLL